MDRSLRIRAVLATGVTACAIAVVGCGAGGDDSATTATGAASNLPTVTAPRFPHAPVPGNGPGEASTTTTTPNGAAPSGPGPAALQRRLAPFRACLARHGVESGQFSPNFRQGAQGQQQTQPNPAQRQKSIQAGIDCIPSLPPRLRSWAQRLAQRYEQRNG